MQGAAVTARSTRQVARLLGVKVGTLGAAVWTGRVPEPARSPAGDFLWTPADISRASRVFLGRPYVEPREEGESEGAQSS
jgi:hypothetical protein